MKCIQKMSKLAMIFISILLFFTMIAESVIGAEIMKIKPKGNKKITIGVLDPNGAIEVAALFNKEHKEAAKKRGWNIEFFDLKDNIPQASTYMENMMSAGLDAIILHWMPVRGIDKQIKMAFDKGIPVITLVCLGTNFPGVLAEVGPMNGTMAATSAEYMAIKLHSGDKVFTIAIPQIEMHLVRLGAAKGILQAYNLKVAQELQYPFTGDPLQWAYDQTRNTLLGDTKKEPHSCIKKVQIRV